MPECIPNGEALALFDRCRQRHDARLCLRYGKQCGIKLVTISGLLGFCLGHGGDTVMSESALCRIRDAAIQYLALDKVGDLRRIIQIQCGYMHGKR